METISHPVTLERYFFTRSVVVTVDSHRPGEGVLSIGPENKIDLARLEEYAANGPTIDTRDVRC